MRTVFKRILTLLLALCLALPGLPARAEEEPAEQPAIYPLQVVRTPANLEAAGDLGIQGREGLPFVAGEHLHQAIGQRREAAVFSGEWH